MNTKANSIKLLELFFKAITNLTEQEIDDLLEGRLKIQVAGRKLEKKKKADSATQPPREIMNNIIAIGNRESAKELVLALERKSLLALAKECGVANASKTPKEEIVEAILHATFDYQETWNAIEKISSNQQKPAIGTD